MDGCNGGKSDRGWRKLILEKTKPEFQQETGVLFDET
jgi:hypothetical protein